jgi:glycerol kinase
MNHLLAIDQSTSATKAVLFDEAGRLVDRASREHRQIYPQPGWVEHDAEEIWQNVITVLREIASRNAERLPTTIGLAITNQRETFVVFDKRSGRPLHNAIVWQCRRGDAICQDLRSAGRGEIVRKQTGLKLDAYFTGSKLKWLLRERPEIRRQVEIGDALIGTIETYLIYRLTGGEEFATDTTNASRTLLYDIGRLCWDEELCNLFDVPVRALANVRESFDNFGQTDAIKAFPRKLPIYGVMGDSQASLFAQCCFEKGLAKATFGSGTSVMLNTGGQCEISEQGSVSALAWVRQGRPVYALEGLINYSSATIDWLKNQLKIIADASETTSMASAVEDTGGVYLVPAFAGLSAPYWSQDARAAILGMTSHTRNEHVVRAALEAIAYQIRDVLEMMKSESGVTTNVLYADGGATRNTFLMQFTADIAGVELVVAEVAESSARGAAMAAMLALGAVNSLAELVKLRGNVKTYQPTMDRARADQLYSGWRQAVQRVL